MLVEEQAGDQEARQREEHRDADVATRHPAPSAVETQHEQHRHATEPVERGLAGVRPAGRAGARWERGHHDRRHHDKAPRRGASPLAGLSPPHRKPRHRPARDVGGPSRAAVSLPGSFRGPSWPGTAGSAAVRRNRIRPLHASESLETDEDLHPESQRDPARVARRRRRGDGPRSPGHRGRPGVARQAQADVRPAHRHRRPRRHRQRRQGHHVAQQDGDQAGVPPLRLPGRSVVRVVR